MSLDDLKHDYKGKYKIPLVVTEAEEKSLAGLTGRGVSPGLIRAAFQFYLDDEWLHNKGTIGIAQFLKHINKYMHRARPKVQYKPKKAPQGPQMFCVNALLPGCHPTNPPDADADKCLLCGGDLEDEHTWTAKRDDRWGDATFEPRAGGEDRWGPPGYKRAIPGNTFSAIVPADPDGRLTIEPLAKAIKSVLKPEPVAVAVSTEPPTPDEPPAGFDFDDEGVDYFE